MVFNSVFLRLYGFGLWFLVFSGFVFFVYRRMGGWGGWDGGVVVC